LPPKCNIGVGNRFEKKKINWKKKEKKIFDENFIETYFVDWT